MSAHPERRSIYYQNAAVEEWPITYFTLAALGQ
jgi:hypothetical protein